MNCFWSLQTLFVFQNITFFLCIFLVVWQSQIYEFKVVDYAFLMYTFVLELLRRDIVMSILKNIRIRFKNNTGDDYETIENAREIPITTGCINFRNGDIMNENNRSKADIGSIDNLFEKDNIKKNNLQACNNKGENISSIHNNVTEKNIESQNLEKETNDLSLGDNNKVLVNEKCLNDCESETRTSNECSKSSEKDQIVDERCGSSSSFQNVDQENSSEVKDAPSGDSNSSASRDTSDSSGKSFNFENDKDGVEKIYNPEDKDEYRKHIESKMSQLWVLVDNFGKANIEYVDSKYFDFNDFFKNEEQYKKLPFNVLCNRVTDAYKQSGDINAYISTKTELSKNYKSEMLIQATYLKDQLCKLQKFTDQIEMENEAKRNKVEKKLEVFYKKSNDEFKKLKINLTLGEFKEIFDSYHDFRVERILQGETSLNDGSSKDRKNKKNNKENDKENTKSKDNDISVNNVSPEEIKKRNIDFIRRLTGRYSHSNSQHKPKKDKPLAQKVVSKSQNISQLQFVERKCNYTLINCPELIRDISRLDYNENGFQGHLDIDTLCQEMRNYLLTHTISRYHFSQKVLGMSGGALNELLNKPRVFEELTEKGITSFLKIRVYLDIVKSKGPYEGKKLTPENIALIKKLNKYYQWK
ncbi:Homeodomain protein CUT and Lambda repressor-like, DNA-binding domain-containing protein [Strongyloides ratti]|uniref:Homeodomain protein CUT and Lambda repressor-like, DNA-binding domain-containing protein n=1 Tax=Strongyloides ratti TaxID=34506 RepID=A0A090LGI0_STRRB|nr:Homeodomain protein CUT and Lambda repressor-like, DNA-binding domain-containing protein [Strongyloides ratti]CEF68911.1 Homeodomain protein CUT and Lambda repressor-like, DNA-binding domain-containing protein [Strongyloides ratti]